MHDAYPVSNIRSPCTYCGWSSILTVLFIKFPSTISWEKVSIPYLQENSHFQYLLNRIALWLAEIHLQDPAYHTPEFNLTSRIGFNLGAGKGGLGGGEDWAILYVGYIGVIYRYQAFSFSLSSQKNKMLDQAWSQVQLTTDPAYISTDRARLIMDLQSLSSFKSQFFFTKLSESFA